MNTKYLSSGSVVSGLIWTFLERCGNQGVHFVVSIILARLLLPSVFGTIAIISVFTGILGIFINFGFSTALIQKKDADDLDYSSVFYFNLLSGCVIYCLLFMLAPWIASFYNDDSLIPYIRVYSLALVLGSLKSVQQVFVRKNYMFQKFFWATLTGTVLAAVLGIWMAYHGYGPWALIAQSLLNLSVDTIFLWFVVSWRPKWIFSFQRLSSLFDFGWKIFASGILDTFYGKLRTICIGKVYTLSDLAFYHKGSGLPQLVVDNINGSINTVLFPSMSAMQDNKPALRAYTKRAIKTSTYLIMPMMAMLAGAADSIVLLLLTEKWLPAVFFLRIACVVYAFYPVQTTNLCAIKALGRSDIFFKLEMLKKMIGLALLFSTLWISVKALAASAILSCFSSQIINSYPNKKLLDYSYGEQIHDMCPQILLSLVTAGVVFSFVYLKMNPWLTLGMQLISGAVVYLGGSMLFHLESYEYSKGFVKGVVRKLKSRRV